MRFFSLLLLINFGIAWFNACGAGNAWAETKAVGGWRHLMNRAAAIMSASGFTFCYLFVLTLCAHALGYLNDDWTGIGIKLGYIIIVPGLLSSGLVIAMDSWARAYRDGGILRDGEAGWNTYAGIHHTLSWLDSFRAAFFNVTAAFDTCCGDEQGLGVREAFIITLVILGGGGGALVTISIIKLIAARHPLRSWDELLSGALT